MEKYKNYEYACHAEKWLNFIWFLPELSILKKKYFFKDTVPDLFYRKKFNISTLAMSWPKLS